MERKLFHIQTANISEETVHILENRVKQDFSLQDSLIPHTLNDFRSDETCGRAISAPNCGSMSPGFDFCYT